ncbi:transcription elongation factor GreA [Micrococcales bacterium 31B]|nr:transcription elongation factor GreA [Micrococcales bacterium 31B]
MSDDANVTWLTQEAYDRLAAELEHLTGPARAEITEKIAAARAEGDLKENGGYHAAREEQGKQEARIRQLEALLKSAKVGAAPTSSSDQVGPGIVVTVHMAGSESRFLLGSREIAATTDLEVYSEQSPLGNAINGLKVGDETSFLTPRGKEIAVKILKVEPFTG